MSITWKKIWEAHSDIFIARNWEECPEDKKKKNRLSPLFAYFMGGETTLRAGIVASSSVMHEVEFFLAGVLWGNRLSNGAKTVIYYVAPDFSPAFLDAVSKIGGNISARAVYWREKLTPSLYLIPEKKQSNPSRYVLGEERPDWKRWGQSLNSVAQQQLGIIKSFFDSLLDRRVRTQIKSQSIAFLWGNFEIAEVRRKGKTKFELKSKVKWLKNNEKIAKWKKLGWVDAAGSLNSEFCTVILKMLDYLESLEKEGKLHAHDLLALWFHQGDGVLKSIWGEPWPWPWLPRGRSENSLLEFEGWYFFQGNGHLSVVCPILEKPHLKVSQSILLSGILEKSQLLVRAKDAQGNSLVWDGRVHWLTTLSLEEDLRRWYCWLNDADKFPLWTLPEDWQEKGVYELNCRTLLNHSIMQKDYT